MAESSVPGAVPVKHPPFKEGSRRHVIWWSGGLLVKSRRHCSEPNCEVNREK